jgi:hypothetical protein
MQKRGQPSRRLLRQRTSKQDCISEVVTRSPRLRETCAVLTSFNDVLRCGTPTFVCPPTCVLLLYRRFSCRIAIVRRRTYRSVLLIRIRSVRSSTCQPPGNLSSAQGNHGTALRRACRYGATSAASRSLFVILVNFFLFCGQRSCQSLPVQKEIPHRAFEYV